MKLVCIHCGRAFVIKAEQLGRQGACPHCHGAIILPRAEAADEDSPGGTNPYALFDYSVSALASMIFHMLLLFAVVFYQAEGSSPLGPAEEVSIGSMPESLLERAPVEELQLEALAETASPSALTATLELQSPVAAVSDAAEADLALATPTAGTTDPNGFNLGSAGAGAAGGMAGGGSWDGMLQTLRRHGLEVVIVFDSTGSMSGEINEVKDQIQRIATTLFTLVPRSRIGLCTYRDEGDAYLTRGLPLTSDVRQLTQFLEQVEAGGGGDQPEAVQAGLQWTIDNNTFRPAARKVILLFGDAPPHAESQNACERLARTFRGQAKGLVSTVTCRAGAPMPEFYAIADAGGGEAFLSANEKQIMSQLMVLVFGSQHREKVLEAFRLLEK
jgi:DNA-directed RNA polymerase subunit RPC12/RpoP